MTAQVARIPFGRTGQLSSRILFGAAALGAMKQERADQLLELLLEFGVNHIDTAASYGESELRLAPWLRERRRDFFLATKTGERTRDKARAQLHRSLERLGVERVDLIQMHNLVEPDEQAVALGPGGALEALVEARAQGLVRFIGVTGHGTQVAKAHLHSLSRFAFDSVLLPYNHAMMASREYAAEFEALVALCAQLGVAVQTIKAIARRRWAAGDESRRFSWYEPIRDEPALRRAVRWVLQRPGFFLNSSSDATLLRATLEAAVEPVAPPSDAEMRVDTARLGVEPLFVRGVSDRI
ncbi:MAG TPA: aldo/keto reductase [Myxococcota bacterium]|nr:aldo/keto reductase [Myxococcota bacterium]